MLALSVRNEHIGGQVVGVDWKVGYKFTKLSSKNKIYIFNFASILQFQFYLKSLWKKKVELMVGVWAKLCSFKVGGNPSPMPLHFWSNERHKNYLY